MADTGIKRDFLTAPEPRPVFVAQRRSTISCFDTLCEIFRYRPLLFMLAARDLKILYHNSAIGLAWVILQPVLIMMLLTVVFWKLAGVGPDGVPYSLFILSALLPWQVFSKSFGESVRNLETSRNLITKVYFPRLLIPLSAVLAAMVDFCVGLGVLSLIMAGFGITPPIQILVLPLAILYAVVSSCGVSAWLAALNILYRDVGHAMPFLTQLWFFSTPIFYRVELVPHVLRPLYWCNPMVGVVEIFRWSILDMPFPNSLLLLISACSAVLVLLSGLLYFRNAEGVFADLV